MSEISLVNSCFCCEKVCFFNQLFHSDQNIVKTIQLKCVTHQSPVLCSWEHLVSIIYYNCLYVIFSGMIWSRSSVWACPWGDIADTWRRMTTASYRQMRWIGCLTIWMIIQSLVRWPGKFGFRCTSGVYMCLSMLTLYTQVLS